MKVAQKKISKPKEKLITKVNDLNNIQSSLIKKSIECLTKLSENTKSSSKDLLEISHTPFLYLILTAKKLPEKVNITPVKIDLPNPLYGNEFSTKHCFILSNQFKEQHKEKLSLLKKNWKFISYDKLCKNYKSYAQKLALAKDYDLFFCDHVIYMLLKEPLGRNFYRQKRFPNPVNLSEFVEEDQNLNFKKFEEYLNTLITRSTFFTQGNGPEYSLKVGRLIKGQESKATENVISSIKSLLKILETRGLDISGVRRLALKSESTESLPIYSYLSKEEKEILKEALAETKK